MTSFFKPLLLVIFMILVSLPAGAEDKRLEDHVLGDAHAPIKVDEYLSLTCSHCAEFYTNILPVLEKKYVDTKKARFVMHDFPLDGLSLKAAALARCMPDDEYLPFVKTLFASQGSWATSANPEANVIQYAKLGGLTEDKAKACLADNKLQDAIIAERTEATTKYQIGATPTFIINDGVEVIKGAQGAEAFGAVFDRLLVAKK